ncbi:MAG: glycosyltransferase family 4 protein [Desulfobacteraceae bacterium]|nr:glycosyltransferase family 4 protein [Desulfobacteraceae bacterium]
MPDRPLRICLLSYRSNPHCGGQGVYVRNLSHALHSLGHCVDVISGPEYPVLDNGVQLIKVPGLDLYNQENPFRVPRPKELANPVNMLEWLGVSTMGFPEPFTFGIRAGKLLARHGSNYDIIHDNQSLSYGLWFIKRRMPAIATIHHPITVDRDVTVKTETALWRKLKSLRWYSFIGMQKRVARTLPHLITVSKFTRRHISGEFKIPEERFSVVPNGINTELFYPMPEIRRESNRIIVTNSADTPLKGLHHLLPAIAAISAKRDIKLIVVGTPKKNGMVEKLVRELEIGSIVTFTGRISYAEFVHQYARATMAVVPSVYEGFGLPAGEAMACAVPVISTTGGALPEVVGDAGVLVPPADPAALEQAVAELLDNPQKARRLGEAGYKRVQKHLTWTAVAEKTVETYQRAINDYHRLRPA